MIQKPKTEIRNPESRNRESGFTLLELIIVMILSLMILGLVSISLASFSTSARLQATVREFAVTLKQARHSARINGEPSGLMIDLDSREYGLEGRRTRKIPSDLGFKVVDPRVGEIINGKYRLVFEPNQGLDQTVFQISNQKKTVLINLDPLMGTVVSR
jgi:type II secretion system protein H